MSDDFGNIHIIIGATKVGNAAVVVKSEIAASTARNVSAKTGSPFGAVVAVQFSCSQGGLGPLVAGLQSLLGLAVAVKITLYAGPVIHIVLIVLPSAVVVIFGPVGLGFVEPSVQLSFSLVDVTTSSFFSIQTAAIVYHLVVEGGIPITWRAVSAVMFGIAECFLGQHRLNRGRSASCQPLSGLIGLHGKRHGRIENVISGSYGCGSHIP